MAVLLVACGDKVEVPPATIGKIMGMDGYREGTIPTSRFRLDVCWAYCDRLVTLSVADFSVSETMELFMPQDRLTMTFDLRLTMTPKPEDYDSLFNRIAPTSDGQISLESAYTTYAQQIIRTESRELLSQYTIAQIASSREAINAELTERLVNAIQDRTPFQVRFVGIADIDYPAIIITAQEAAAQRREEIQQEEAQLERELQEERLKRAIEMEKAQAQAEVNQILADSVTEAYVTYRQLEALQAISVSENTKFVPVEMLSSMATQLMLADPARR